MGPRSARSGAAPCRGAGVCHGAGGVAWPRSARGVSLDQRWSAATPECCPWSRNLSSHGMAMTSSHKVDV